MKTWNKTIDIKGILRDEDLTFEEKRDAIAAKVKASSWYKEQDSADFPVLHQIVEEMEDCDEVEWFDSTLTALYDEADYDRVWLGL